MNPKYGKDFGEHEKLNIQQIVDIVTEDEMLRTQAQNNPYEDFIVESYEKDQGF